MFRSISLLLTALVCLASVCRGSVVIAVDSPAVTFSPGNWAGDAGRGGSVYRISWNNGAYCTWRWTTTAAAPSAKLLMTNSTAGSTIAYFLDGNLIDNVPVTAEGGIAISAVAPGAHELTVCLRSSRQSSRWDRTNGFKVAGLEVDDGATPGAAVKPRPWVLIVGDSITEGIAAGTSNGRREDSNLSDYSFLIGQGLLRDGYDYGISACGWSGWLHPGDGTNDVPPYYFVSRSTDASGWTYDDAKSRWNKIDGKTSLLDTDGHLSGWGGRRQEPTAVLINYGTNEAIHKLDPDDMQASVTACLAALRKAAPDAGICLLIPPGLYNTRVYPTGPAYTARLKAAVGDYAKQFPEDSKTVLLDLGPALANALASPAYGGEVHPDAAGHAYLAPLVLRELLATMHIER